MIHKLRKYYSNLNEHPLLNRMIFYIFLFGLTMTLSLSWLKLHLTTTYEVANLHRYLDNIQDRQLHVLAKNIWGFNEETIEIQLDSMIQHQDIIFLNLAVGNKQYTAGNEPESRHHLLTRTFPIYYNFKGENNKIADLTILATTSQIKHKLLSQLPGIIALELAKMIVVCAFILLLFHYLFNKHLLQIADFAQTIDFHGLDRTLTLHRHKKQDQPDELDRIVLAMNDMQQRLLEDLTEKEKLGANLRQAQKMEAIGTMAGGIAHDFNNILTAIFGYTELATLHLDYKEKLVDDLNEVRQGATRAKDLVQQILTFSRKGEQTKQPLQISLIVKEVIKLLRSSIPSTITIKQQIEAVEQTVLADPTQIHQILLNLSTNAYHAMREDGGTLSIALREKSLRADDPALDKGLPPGQYLELEISDTGSGIEKQTQDKIFEPYFTTKDIGEGTGLGLAVVHGIVKDHQGTIHLHSKLNQGTSFYVYLPVIKKKITALKKNPTSLNSASQGSGQHILFVDDEIKILNLAKEIIEAYGYKVTTCNTPEQALALVSQSATTYDLLVTDMTMPQMTGIELAKKIMDIRPEMPIFLCTGHSDLIDRDSAHALGIKEYINKPLVMSKLVNSIKKALQNETTHG